MEEVKVLLVGVFPDKKGLPKVLALYELPEDFDEEGFHYISESRYLYFGRGARKYMQGMPGSTYTLQMSTDRKQCLPSTARYCGLLGSLDFRLGLQSRDAARRLEMQAALEESRRGKSTDHLKQPLEYLNIAYHQVPVQRRKQFLAYIVREITK